MAEIILETAFEDIAFAPFIDSSALFFVIHVTALVLISGRYLFPQSNAVPQSVAELTLVKTSVFPKVLSLAVRPALLILSSIEVSVSEYFLPLSMF